MKHLHLRCEQYCIILPSKNKNRFLETLSRFCIFEKALFLDPRNSMDPRDSKLDTRDSILKHLSIKA